MGLNVQAEAWTYHRGKVNRMGMGMGMGRGNSNGKRNGKSSGKSKRNGNGEIRRF